MTHGSDKRGLYKQQEKLDNGLRKWRGNVFAMYILILNSFQHHLFQN